MSAVYQYYVYEGHKKHRSWNPLHKEKFNALIKCFVMTNGKLKTIEKPSTEPATFHQCCRKAEVLKHSYGSALQQLYIWDMDEINEMKRRHDEGEEWNEEQGKKKEKAGEVARTKV
ncbi:hypothetical protein HF072_00705 [Bacillus sp. RO3]|nr:hypothetical protein [Bacillus sp. RO3]